jgi:protoporphyrin/coproporphyrin ferrochelatase
MSERETRKGKKGVLLVNLGTPDQPDTSNVRTYLTEFLNDPRVIDISAVGRAILVNAFIVPFRSSKSAALYKQVWTERGSPLLFHTEDLRDKVQKKLGDSYFVAMAMRYRKPSIGSALELLRKEKVSEITILPLYPQYASSSTGSTIEKIFDLMKRWEVIPSVRITSSFFDHPAFINSFVVKGKQHMTEPYEHYLFSYHGLPERQIKKASAHYGGDYCQLGKCCNTINKNNQYCYRANCFETTRQLVKALGIPDDKWSVSFQSRLGRDPWIKPYSDHVIEDLGKKGVKKILVFSPAFVADCLETIYEIGHEYLEIFQKHGGEELKLVTSLNAEDHWVDAVCQLVTE